MINVLILWNFICGTSHADSTTDFIVVFDPNPSDRVCLVIYENGDTIPCDLMDEVIRQ